jgi:hypothetical protein
VVVKPYTGDFINPLYSPDAESPNDEGVADLNPDDYMALRLEDQLNWHTNKIEEHQRDRRRYIILILITGGIGSLLASIDFIVTGIAVWVALATAISTAITNWKELLGLDIIVSNYSKVILELNILRDHWNSLDPHEQTQPEFFRTVRATENLLWSQQLRFISAMRESMEEAEAEQQKIVEEMIEISQEVAGRVQEEIIEDARRSMEEATLSAAAEMPLVDEQRLPEGTIFSAALGPAPAVIVDENAEDALDGFETASENEDESEPESNEQESKED